MTVESALYPTQLNTSWPQASDLVSEGDNHIRLTKTVIKTTFPNVAGKVSATDVELSYVAGVTSAIQDQLNARALKAGDTYSGTHDFTGAAVTVPTRTEGDDTNNAASTAFVKKAVGAVAATQVAAAINGATSKTTPVDADELGITDSAASWGLKKLTFANLKAWIGSLFVSKAGDTMTGPLAQAAGTAALPSYTFSGDTNTGMWAPAADVLAWSTAGAERLRIDTTGNVLVTGSGGLGYGTGSGGTVTQETSKSTEVTLNKPSGLITMNNAALAAGATAIFTFNNSSFTSNDAVLLTIVGQVADKYTVRFAHIAEGAGSIAITNNTAGSLSEAIGINFVVVKAARS